MQTQGSQLYEINAHGVVACAQQVTSPNQDDRPSDVDSPVIDMVVIHNISLPPKQYGGHGIIELFTNQLNPNEHPTLLSE